MKKIVLLMSCLLVMLSLTGCGEDYYTGAENKATEVAKQSCRDWLDRSHGYKAGKKYELVGYMNDDASAFPRVYWLKENGKFIAQTVVFRDDSWGFEYIYAGTDGIAEKPKEVPDDVQYLPLNDYLSYAGVVNYRIVENEVPEDIRQYLRENGQEYADSFRSFMDVYPELDIQPDDPMNLGERIRWFKVTVEGDTMLIREDDEIYRFVIKAAGRPVGNLSISADENGYSIGTGTLDPAWAEAFELDQPFVLLNGTAAITADKCYYYMEDEYVSYPLLIKMAAPHLMEILK